MNNVVQDSGEWKQRPLRTVPASLGGLLAFLIVGLGISYGLISIVSGSSQCAELALLGCGMALAPIAAIVAIGAEVLMARHMLQKKGIPHSVAIPLLVPFTVLVFAYAFAGVQNTIVLCLVSGLIFVASFVFYDWFFNRVQGRFDSKILRIIAGLVVVIIAGFLLSFYVLR